jgi:hypothetical protein
VEPANQLAEVSQCEIGHGPRRVRRQRHVPVDPRKNLATKLVRAKVTGRAVEADGFEMQQEVAYGRS